MDEARFQVAGLGNALVDALVQVSGRGNEAVVVLSHLDPKVKIQQQRHEIHGTLLLI